MGKAIIAAMIALPMAAQWRSPIPIQACVHSSAASYSSEIVDAAQMWNRELDRPAFAMPSTVCQSEQVRTITISVGRVVPYWAWMWNWSMPEPLAGDIVLSDSALWLRIGRDLAVLVIAHEFGHALGLRHSADPGSVMHNPPLPGARITEADREAARKAWG